MHTAFVREIPAVGACAASEKREYDHLFKTLRCRDGEKLRLCDGRGVSALAEAVDRGVLVRERTEHQRDRVRVHLYAAQPKAARLDDILKPAAEAGAVSITPLVCRYSVARRETPSERWHTLLVEGCKQSGNPFLPDLRPALTPDEAVREIQRLGQQAFFGKPDGVLWNGEGLTPTGDGTLELAWLVGPEGGFAPEEEALFLDNGMPGLGLGPYIMRLETAALAGMVYLGQTARRKLEERESCAR